MIRWMEFHEIALLWLGFASLITFVGTLFALPLLVVRIPEDYFTRASRPFGRRRNHHPVIRIFIMIVKNIIGITFILAGIAMLFLPGQGILTILIGITLTNFPGKMALERWLIRHRPVHQTINWLRKRSHRPPLQVPRGPKRPDP